MFNIKNKVSGCFYLSGHVLGMSGLIFGCLNLYFGSLDWYFGLLNLCGVSESVCLFQDLYFDVCTCILGVWTCISSCVIRRKFLLCHKKKFLLVAQEEMSSCVTRRNFFL